jgi:hypothetical protein
MIPHHRVARLVAATAFLLASSGCVGARHARMSPPDGLRALGLEFGKDRSLAMRALDAAGIPWRPAPGDPDALLADRCPQAPVAVPCRLVFGPEGLYAAQLEVGAAEEAALVDAVESALGRPARRQAASAGAGTTVLLASWEQSPWTVGVSRVAPEGAPPSAVLRLEYDPAAPPVVAGVPLGRLRADVEHLLDRQGATVISRDAGSTAYLGCPLGDGEALSCVVVFRSGRAASVTEVHVTPAEDTGALAAWRELAGKLEAETGRAPARECPPSGPDRIAGDCTATWSTPRLAVVAGAHRNAGAKHRGAITVYTAFTYPPLAPPAEAEGDGDARTSAQ